MPESTSGGGPPAPSSRPLSIVHIAAPSRVGGLERVVYGLATGHAGRGHDVSVISLVSPGQAGHPLSGAIEEGGARVYEFEFRSRAVIAERKAVRRVLKDIRPDVVHTHGYRPDVLHATTARALSIATVTTEHGSSKLGGKTVLYEWVQRRSFRRFGAVVAVSSPIARQLAYEGIPPDKIRLIPNGWMGDVSFVERSEARSILGLSDDCKVVGYVGRLIRAKGPDLFVEAILRLDDQFICGAVIGDGGERDHLEATIRATRSRTDVRLLGHLDQVAHLFKAFDLFVLSSRTEGTPITLLEAMAAGVPAVVTAVGGVPEVVGPREALLVPPEDPDALASAIRKALATPAETQARTRLASARLEEEFGGDRWLSRHEWVYRDVAGV